MRIAHLADLHLGKVFHGSALVEDQHHALSQCLDYLAKERPDVLVVAGDLYDRALPGRDAVRLLDWFLREVNRGLAIPVIAIAGNHDSGDHLGFGAWLFASGDVHLRGRVEPELQPIVIEDAYGEVVFYPLPYVEPEAARDLGLFAEVEDGALSHRDLVESLLRQARAHRDSRPAGRSVVIAHAFATGLTAPEESRRSERTLYLGGLGAVPVDAFAGFDYSALGHLHRPQNLRPDGAVRYAGSLLKYSFDEWLHAKSMTVATLDGGGFEKIEALPITPRRDLARVEGDLETVLCDPSLASLEGAFVSFSLSDYPPPLQAMERLRKRFPHAAELHFPTPTPVDPAALAGAALPAHDPMRAFELFFTRHSAEAPTESEREVFREALRRAEGESP
ncbi:MAG: exonuclease SbcCD subunit D [Myxococcales bacterium]|nr:exonuclease SbcCD subunit D [Myxococcales bacterium]